MAFTTLSPLLRLLLLPVLASVLVPSSANAQQQEIECIVPGKAGSGERPVYKTGQSVQFEWKATYPLFNMTITQANSKTNDKIYHNVYRNEPNTTANFIWTAHSLAGLGQNDPLHLYIVNAADKDCPTCACRSSNFTVLDATASSNTSDPSPSTTAPSDSTSSTSSSPAGSGSSSEHFKLGLGLGLGLGIPLLITLTALATWLCVRRRRQERQQRQAAINGYDDINGPPSAIPLSASQRAYTQQSLSLGGYVSDPSEKSPAPEMDSQPVVEMQGEDARVEAPQDAYRAELATGEEEMGMGMGMGGARDVKIR